MRKLFWIGILVAAFYGHSRFVFSESAVMGWMQTQQNMALRGDEGLCDAYADNVRVNLHMQTERGEMVVEGGKEELCDYLKDASAAIRVTRPSLNINNELVSLEPAGFPWLSATVKLRQTSSMRLRGMPAMEEVSDSTYVLKRTLTGRKIAAIDAESSVSMGQ